MEETVILRDQAKTLFVYKTAVLLTILFAYTSTSKFLEHAKFVFQMELAPVPFMKILAPALSWVLPVIEFIVAVGLVLGMFVSFILRYAIQSALILLIAFELYITIMLWSGLNLPCTCGGIISAMSWKQHLLFNAVCIAMSTGAALTIRNNNSRTY